MNGQKIITEYYMNRRDRTDFTTLMHFPKIHRSVPCKITKDLLYFRGVYDVDLWQKYLGRSKAYSCRGVNVLKFHHFKKKKKKTVERDEDQATQARHFKPLGIYLFP